MTQQTQNLHMQLNHFKQDLNNIMQMAGQLSQQEQSNVMELQRLRQLESNANQQLQRIQQICSGLNNSLSQISGMTQQFGAQIAPSHGTSAYAQNFGQYSVVQPEYRNPSLAQNFGQSDTYSAMQPQFGTQTFSAGPMMGQSV